MTLHIVSQSPEAGPALMSCLRVAKHNDVIILINDAVYALATQTRELASLADEQRLFALEVDLLTRGLTTKTAITIDYVRFVELSCQYNPIQSWY